MKRLFVVAVFLLMACSLSLPGGTNNPGTTGSNTPQAAPTIALDPNVPTFFVAADGNDDSGDGSQASPWATITHALDSVSDGSLILVRPGLYVGRVRIRGWFESGVTVRSEIPYQAQLRADETVLTIFEAQGISIEGFDIAHLSPAATDIVVQIQDATDEIAGGERYTNNITLRNNILHDSYTNDILKINNGVQQIYVIGNLFYNQGDSDEHIDVNSVRDVVIEDNIFFNAFEASGREVSTESSSFIVAKDSNEDEDGIVGLNGLTIRRNIFFHFQGSEGQYMILLGEDGKEYFEAQNVLIENNLFLGDGGRLRAPFGTKGVRDVVFRNNTITGDMLSGAFAWRSNTEDANQPNTNIQLFNNIFSDPTGTMDNFATAPQGETDSFTLGNNLYWNGGQPLPGGNEDMVQISADNAAVLGDPLLNNPANLVLPVWDPGLGLFGGGAIDIRAVFLQLVQAYAIPQAGSAAIDQADPANASGEDILGQVRSGPADIGAYEVQGDEQVVQLPTLEPGSLPPTNEPEPVQVGESGSVSQSTLQIPASGGIITFAIRDGENERVFRLNIAPNAVPEDLSALIDAAAQGENTEWVQISLVDGVYLISTDRFDPECVGWACLVTTRDFVNFEVVKSPEGVVHAEAASIANNDLIVFQLGGGSHNRDLWAIRRAGDGWTSPVELTGASPYQNNQPPGFSSDASRIVFACGDDTYASVAICEVNTDGSEFSVLFRADDLAAGGLVFSPRYTPDGSIVFEGTWNGEQIWKLTPGSSIPTVISSLTNDNSPCVMPDGTIVSLWLQREGNISGVHEIKLMSPDGSQYAMLLIGVDVFDAGLGCGLAP